MMARAKRVHASTTVKVNEYWKKHPTLMSVAMAVLAAAVIAIFLVWVLTPKEGYLPQSSSKSVADGLASGKVGTTLIEHANRLNELGDKVKANRADIEQLKGNVSSLKAGQAKVEKGKFDLDEFNRELDRQLKIPALKPLSQLRPEEIPSQGGNFPASLAG